MIETAIFEAVAAGANIVVLPELVTSGYVFKSKTEIRSLALANDPQSFEGWIRTLANTNSVVVGGYPELGPDGVIYNSVAVVGREGVLASYRKVHLWDDEKRWFAPGREVPPIVETGFGKLGLLICYDLEFPETVRDLAICGAELIVVPTNWPLSPRPVGERPAEMGSAMVAARLSRVFIACCDRVGTERGVEWTGGSCVIDTEGWIIAQRPQRDGGLVVADVDTTQARNKSLNRNNDVMRDRHPELYHSLIEDVA